MAPHHIERRQSTAQPQRSARGRRLSLRFQGQRKQADSACVCPMLAIVLTAFAVKGTRSAKSELLPSGCRPAVTGYRARWESITPRPLRRATSHASRRWAAVSRSRIASRLRMSSSWTSIGRRPHHTLPHRANAGRAAQRHYDAGLNATILRRRNLRWTRHGPDSNRD